MTEERTGIALLGRSVCGAVRSPVSYRHTTDGPGWPPLTARAYVLEGVAVQTVAADPAVFDTEAATYYGHGVEHPVHLARPSVASQGAPQHSERDAAAGEQHPSLPGPRDADTAYQFYWHPKAEQNHDRERARLARLSRWQEQRWAR